MGYLVQELHTSARWPILVFSYIYKMYGNINTGMHPHSSCIIPTPGQCEEWELHIAPFWQQLYESFHGKNSRYPWNPRAKFIVSVTSNCTHMENTQFSRAILCELWGRAVTNPIVPFLKSNEHGGKDLHQHIADLAQSTYLELHTCYP